MTAQPRYFSLPHQIYERSVDSHRGDTARQEDHLDALPPEASREVPEGLCLSVAAVAVADRDLPLLGLEMEDRAPLRMVHRGRAVEHAQQEGQDHGTRDGLQSVAPLQ